MHSTFVPTANVAASPASLRPSFNDMNEKYWYLKKYPAFAELNADEIRVLDSVSQVQQYSRGDVIYFPGDNADSTMLLTSGRVRIYHITGDGKQAILGFVEANETFGELSAFQNSNRGEYAEALEKCVVLVIPQHALRQQMEQQPSVAMKMTEVFSARARNAERRLKSLLFGSSRDRLWDLLEDLAARYGVPNQDGVVIAQKISHQDLASIIGATRETVTITLGELQNEGLIEINRRRITMKNPKAAPEGTAS